MENEGKPLAADELDPAHHAPPGTVSVHIRALLTWLAIFPMVAIGMTVLGLFAGDWHPVLRAFVLTAVVVPTAVYLVVPNLLRAYGALARRRARTRSAAAVKAADKAAGKAAAREPAGA